MRNNLEILLINKGYNQKLFAEEIGVNPKTFHYQLKRWKNQPFQFYTMVADKLKMSTKELLEALKLI